MNTASDLNSINPLIGPTERTLSLKSPVRLKSRVWSFQVVCGAIQPVGYQFKLQSLNKSYP